jgi:high affinity Mn2+ porin
MSVPLARLHAAVLTCLWSWSAAATDDGADQRWALHGQSTVVYQYHPSFDAPYTGRNSLAPEAQGKETVDATAYVGLRLTRATEIWITPEIDQGFGLSNTLGMAGFPSAEAYKVGSSSPYGRIHRAFVRQTFDFAGEDRAVESDLAQFAGTHSGNRLVITAGKFSVVDVFDTNLYAHDPRNDFLNWALVDSAAFDYAANAWGYTYGVAAELYRGATAVRLGLFDLSKEPNSEELGTDPLHQYQIVAEIEQRYSLGDQPGAVRLLGYVTHAGLGDYDEAAAIARSSGQPADIASVRRTHEKYGAALNVEQALTANIGAFARLSAAQGRYEAFDFTDVNRSYAAGVSIAGAGWKRPEDRVGAAFVVNQSSGAAHRFLDAGGLGILIGDGQLPHPGSEEIAEVFYRLPVLRHAHVSLDYQYVRNPGYNRDRGPVSVVGARVHAQF